MKRVCPRCGSSQVRKYGKVRLQQGILQKFRCMSCKHVWHTRIVQCIPEDMSDLVFRMFRAFIRDIDAGKCLSDAGWIPLNDNEIERLREIDFCEIDYENMNGRINYKSQIPTELLLTEEGRVFHEFLRAVGIAQKVEALKNNDAEYLKAVAAGLNEMLKNAQFIFWEKKKGFIPEKLHNVVLSPKWGVFAKKIAYLLTVNLLESIWGISDVSKLHLGSNKEEIAGFNSNINSVINEIKENPQWAKIIDFFRSNKDVLEALSLAWFVSQRAIEEEIGYLGAELLILETAMKIVADKNNEDVAILREKLANLNEELYRLVCEEIWGVNWNDVFRLP